MDSQTLEMADVVTPKSPCLKYPSEVARGACPTPPCLGTQAYLKSFEPPKSPWLKPPGVVVILVLITTLSFILV